MAIQTFTTGQVLTAAQVNALNSNDFNQTVSAKTASYTLVAADKGTRITMSSTSATTITVNTGLFSAGDTLIINNLNTGVLTITAGTATVDTSASLALAQHEGGTLYFTSAGVSTFFKSAGAAASGGLTTGFVNTTTAESTSSTTYTNLSTTTATTVTTGTKALVLFGANMGPSSAGLMSFEVSGASSVAASDGNSAMLEVAGAASVFMAVQLTGLTAGSNVFTAKFRVNSGTCGFQRRVISVIDLGS